MITKITLSNFGSIAQPAVVDFSVPGTTPENPRRYISTPGGKRAPSVISLFGPNGSGKSTLLHSLVYLRNVATGREETSLFLDECIHVPASLCKGCEKLPVEIELQFVANWLGVSDALYSYSITILPKQFLEGVIDREELKYKRGSSWVSLISRDKTELKIEKDSDFPKELIKLAPKIISLKENESFFPQVASFGKENIARKAISSANYKFITNSEFERSKSVASYDDVTKQYVAKPDLLARLNRMIRTADIGIEKIEVQTFEKATKKSKNAKMEPDTDDHWLLSKHRGLGKSVPYFLESQGTQNFIAIFPKLVAALECGGIAAIDELDSDLHPNLLQHVVGWFHNPKENPHGAQLIIACNSASLLNYLEKDEIFFTEKDDAGRTKIYGMKDIEGVRRDENFYKNYLAGKYGAVPNFG